MLKKIKRIKLGKQLYRRLMKRVFERDGWRCRVCGLLENLQVHHKINRSQQGNDSLENLITLCAFCHMREHGHMFYEPRAIETVKNLRYRDAAVGRRAGLLATVPETPPDTF